MVRVAPRTTTAQTTSAKPKATTTPKSSEDTVLLELVLYTNYTKNGVRYEKGKAYRFKTKTALALLKEKDHGKPIWGQVEERETKPVPKIERPAKPIEDMTSERPARQRSAKVEVEDPTSTKRTGKPVELGDDSELADLDLPGDEGEEEELEDGIEEGTEEGAGDAGDTNDEEGDGEIIRA